MDEKGNLVIGQQAESDRRWVGGFGCVGVKMGHLHPYWTALGHQVNTIERLKREIKHDKNINNLQNLGHWASSERHFWKVKYYLKLVLSLIQRRMTRANGPKRSKEKEPNNNEELGM